MTSIDGEIDNLKDRLTRLSITTTPQPTTTPTTQPSTTTTTATTTTTTTEEPSIAPSTDSSRVKALTRSVIISLRCHRDVTIMSFRCKC